MNPRIRHDLGTLRYASHTSFEVVVSIHFLCLCPVHISIPPERSFPVSTSFYVAYPIIATELAYNMIVEHEVLQYELLQTHASSSLQTYLHPCPSYLFNQVWRERSVSSCLKMIHSSSTSLS